MAKKKTVKKTSTTTPAKKTLKKSGLKKASVARQGAEASSKKGTPIVFSIDDVEALVASRKVEEEVKTPKAAPKAVKKTRIVEVEEDKPAEKRKLGAASLADILGFNPSEKKASAATEESQIPAKWQPYYKLLLELRSHLKDEIDLHTSETLQGDESADSASYGNHQADAGTDTFDRDFALSLVSSEQDALNEIEEAILRMKDGSYGICEETGEEIDKERLMAVPFARFSLQGQQAHEKKQRRKVDRGAAGGLFADATDAPKLASDDDED